MKAVVVSEHGGPETLAMAEAPDPEPGPGQAVVAVAAAGVNFADTMQRAGTYAVPGGLPLVPGMEVAGTVERLGAGVEGVAVGDRVAAPTVGGRGGYAERALVDAGALVPLPDLVTPGQAVALFGQGLTAFYLLRQVAPASGRRVLVHAAAGGVGTLAVQLARLWGAPLVVAAASSEAKLDLARSLGAHHGVDYTRPDWVEQVREATAGKGVDIVLDSVGGEVGQRSLDVLAPFGTQVVFGSPGGEPTGLPDRAAVGRLMQLNQGLVGFSLPTFLQSEPGLARRGLEALLRLVEQERLRVLVDDRFALADAADAHRAVEGRATTGKVVLRVEG